nr:vesicle-associated membrane protein 711 [Tanacetum cinerariifolium]
MGEKEYKLHMCKFTPSSKDDEPSKKTKSTETSKGTTKSQPKSIAKSAQVEEIVFEAGDTQVPQTLGEDMGNTDEPPIVNADLKDWFKKPKRPHTLDLEWNKCKTVDNKPTHAFTMNLMQISDLTQEILVGLVYKLFKGTCRSYVELEYNMKECYKALNDQLDWNNPKGDFLRLHLNDIEDMLLLVAQSRLFELDGDVIVHLVAALHMFTRRIVIQKRVEDLQLGKDSILQARNPIKKILLKLNLPDHRNGNATWKNGMHHGKIGKATWQNEMHHGRNGNAIWQNLYGNIIYGGDVNPLFTAFVLTRPVPLVKKLMVHDSVYYAAIGKLSGELDVIYSPVLPGFNPLKIRQILEKLPGNSDDLNVSYSQDRYIFHVKRTDSLTVLCMADDVAGRRIPFAFLEDIHQRFVRTYGRAVLSAQAYGMNDEFSRVLSQQMEYYSNDPNADRINRLKGEMGQVRTVMLENIDKVLDRGDRLELLVDKTATMQNNTLRFRKQTRRFRSSVWWRNVKLTIALILLILVIIYLVLAFVCHGVTLPSCI